MVRIGKVININCFPCRLLNASLNFFTLTLTTGPTWATDRDRGNWNKEIKMFHFIMMDQLCCKRDTYHYTIEEPYSYRLILYQSQFFERLMPNSSTDLLLLIILAKFKAMEPVLFLPAAVDFRQEEKHYLKRVSIYPAAADTFVSNNRSSYLLFFPTQQP